MSFLVEDDDIRARRTRDMEPKTRMIEATHNSQRSASMLRDGSVEVEATWCGVEREDGHEQRCEQLHRRLKRIVKARGALDAQEAEALREADATRMWRHYGYSSLLEYMEMEMGYTPRAALERLRVAKAIVDLPEIAEAMTQGDLSFSGARELTRVATPETEEQWLEAANDKNLREIEALVSGHEPGDKPTDPVEPKLRKRVLRYEVNAETVAIVRQAKQVFERELGEHLDDDALLRAFARLVIDGGAAPERTRAPYQIAVSTCGQCKRGWQDGGGITVEMTPPALEAARCDAQHIGSVDGDESESAARRRAKPETLVLGDAANRQNYTSPRERDPQTSSVERAKSDIPPALRRKVIARDHGRCRVPWCRSSRNVDLHHLEPQCRGGKHTLENILSLCESHHLAHHEGALIIEGTATNATFTRRTQSSFTTATLAVDTATALKSLGFKRHEVSAAIERTRTHVGTTELSLEQWIKIALSYCPKPRG